MYSEEAAISHIKSRIDPAVAAMYDDDEFLNVIDMIYDYYESNGMLDPDNDDSDDEEDEEELLDSIEEYAARMIKKDKDARMKPEHLRQVIAAELDYEQSLL